VIVTSDVLRPVLMSAVSPPIGPRPFALLMLPMPVLASNLRAPWECWLFGYADACIVLTPVYDLSVVPL
jgi:hypothetical protein